MKKIVRLIVLLLVMVSIPSFSYAQKIKKDNVANGSYIIGSYLFNKEKSTNYNGTLTTPMVMLASKSINSNNYYDMKIYYKNARGNWLNAITGEIETNIPNEFEITCINLNCASGFAPTDEGYEIYKNESIGNGTYIIGRYLFNKETNAAYNGTLTTQLIMLASKSINSNNLADMKIYYKNARGNWLNAITGLRETNVPNYFYITYVNLTKKSAGGKSSDIIGITPNTFIYDGTNKEATFTTNSGLQPQVTYYSNSTCTKNATPKNVGTYYAKATTMGNENYDPAELGCSKAVIIKKADLTMSLSSETGIATTKDKIYVDIITSSNGTITCSSNNENVKCSISGNRLVITPKIKVNNIKDEKEVKIKVTQAAGTNYNKGTKTYILTLTDEAGLICNSVKNNNTIDYLSFTKPLTSKNNNDDYYAIYAAHYCANKYHKDVVVTSNSVFNIYKYSDKEKLSPIPVKTNTNFNNSTIYIHDENYKYNAENNNSIYKISSDTKVLTPNPSDYANFNDFLSRIFDGNDYNYAYVKIKNKKDDKNIYNNVFIRSGHNDYEGKSDAFKVKREDNKNSVLNKMFWSRSDYNFKNNSIESITVDKIPDNQLVFGNATFITIVNTSGNLTKKELKRGILIQRSNTLITNINHKYVKKDNLNKLLSEKITYGYSGFFIFSQAADILFTNSVVHSIGSSSSNGGSTYDISINDVATMTVENVRMQNDTDQLTSKDVWCALGTNRSKNLTFNNCMLNRIDAHRGVYSLKVYDSVIGWGGIEVTGVGTTNNNKLIISNVVVKGNDDFVILRSDYGSTWNGEIIIKNSSIEPLPSQKTVLLVRVAPALEDNNTKIHNYGYDLYMPDVKVSNFKVNSKNVNKIYVIGIKDITYSQLKKLPIKNNKNGLQTHYEIKDNNAIANDIKKISPDKIWEYINY